MTHDLNIQQSTCHSTQMMYDHVMQMHVYKIYQCTVIAEIGHYLKLDRVELKTLFTLKKLTSIEER